MKEYFNNIIRYKKYFDFFISVYFIIFTINYFYSALTLSRLQLLKIKQNSISNRNSRSNGYKILNYLKKFLKRFSFLHDHYSFIIMCISLSFCYFKIVTIEETVADLKLELNEINNQVKAINTFAFKVYIQLLEVLSNTDNILRWSKIVFFPSFFNF
jgi:hypothetical protein